jgi:hypothetical protein
MAADVAKSADSLLASVRSVDLDTIKGATANSSVVVERAKRQVLFVRDNCDETKLTEQFAAFNLLTSRGAKTAQEASSLLNEAVSSSEMHTSEPQAESEP